MENEEQETAEERRATLGGVGMTIRQQNSLLKAMLKDKEAECDQWKRRFDQLLSMRARP
jgi:hypothetical protein